MDIIKRKQILAIVLCGFCFSSSYGYKDDVVLNIDYNKEVDSGIIRKLILVTPVAIRPCLTTMMR